MKTLSFGVEDARIVDERNDSQFAKLEIDMFASGNNKHDLYVSEATLKKTASSILLKPITWVYDKLYDDVGSHSPLQVPSGFVPSDSEIKFRKLSDSRIMLTVTALIWKRYSGQLLSLFERDGGSKGVSVEMEVFDIDEPRDGVIGEIRDYCYTAVTILGDLFQPAIPMAKATVLSFAKEYEKDYNLEFAKYGKLDFAISEEIKIASRDGLDLAHENGAKSVDLAIANYLIKNKFATPDRIKRLYSKFSKFSKDDLIDKNGKKWITWQLLGGEDCFQWVKLLFEQMNEIEKISKEDFMKKDKDGKPIGEEEEAPEGEPQTTMAEEKSEEMPVKEEEMAVEEEKPKEEEMAAETEEEAKEEEEQEEEKKEEMSLDAYLDVSATLALLQQETEGFKELVPEAVFTATELFSMLLEKYKVVSTENVELKQFKSDIEKQQFDFAVNSTLKEIESSVEIPSEEIESLRTISVDFSIETIDSWKNAAYAKAFTFAKKGDEDRDPIHKYAVGGLYGVAKSKKGLWD